MAKVECTGCGEYMDERHINLEGGCSRCSLISYLMRKIDTISNTHTDNYLTPLHCIILDCGRFVEVAKPFKYYTLLNDKTHDRLTYSDGKTFIIVPAGFISDFASIPWILWSLFPPIGRFSKAAVIHDYLYRYNINSRKWADKVFLEAMSVSEVSWHIKYAYYAGTRILGWIAWRKWAKVLREETS